MRIDSSEFRQNLPHADKTIETPSPSFEGVEDITQECIRDLVYHANVSPIPSD
jgi:hypothetical protein